MRLVSAVLLLTLSTAAHAAAPDIEQRRGDIGKALVGVGSEIRREIVAGDVDALLARVPPEGLRCSGTVIPRAKDARDLRGDGTWLHTVFFGSAGANAPPGAPASLAALLKSAREIAIVVSFRSDKRAGPAGRPCIEFRAKGVTTPGAPLCFLERAGRWWFTESLYPCG